MNLYDIKNRLEGKESITLTAKESADLKDSLEHLLNPLPSIYKNDIVSPDVDSIIFTEEEGIITIKRRE